MSVLQGLLSLIYGKISTWFSIFFMIFTILHLPIYQDYCSNTVGSVSRSYLFLYHCCKIVLSKDLKDVKGDMSHAKILGKAKNWSNFKWSKVVGQVWCQRRLLLDAAVEVSVWLCDHMLAPCILLYFLFSDITNYICTKVKCKKALVKYIAICCNQTSVKHWWLYKFKR